MKLTVSQPNLNSALSLVGRAVSTRPTHPILANVLLTADAVTGRLSLTGYDMSIGICISIQAAVKDSGAITVPARLFGDIINRLPSDEPITLQSAEQLKINSLSGTYHVQQMPAEDFPDLPLAQSGEPFILQAAELIRGSRATLFAASSDESKQLLTGVHLTLGASAEFAATDGHRLAVLTINRGNATADFAITIPASALRELERMLLAAKSAVVDMYADKGQMVFVCSDQIMTCRSFDGTYPSYKMLIPASFNRSITVDRRNLQMALERIAVLAGHEHNVVKLAANSDRGELLISAETKDLGSGSETISAEIKGDSIIISFNVRYLVDGLKAMAAKDVTLKCNSPTTPAIIIGDEEFTYLIMPVQVRS